MSFHIMYDHQCDECKAYYIPYNKGIVCPNCGLSEEEVAENIIYTIVASAQFQKNTFGIYTPIAWWNGSFGDHVALLIFKALDAYEEQDTQEFEEFAQEYFNSAKWGNQLYLKDNVYGLSCEVYKEIKNPTIRKDIIKEVKVVVEEDPIKPLLNRTEDGVYFLDEKLVNDITFKDPSDKKLFYQMILDNNNADTNESILLDIDYFNDYFFNINLVRIETMGISNINDLYADVEKFISCSDDLKNAKSIIFQEVCSTDLDIVHMVDIIEYIYDNIHDECQLLWSYIQDVNMKQSNAKFTILIAT